MGAMTTDEARQGPAGRMTIRDIARLSGVSVATVSRVINGRPDVATRTRDEVMRVIFTEGRVSAVEKTK